MSKTKTLNRQRYRPVSEFDEATLATKREYWRTRKREQRARQCLTAKKLSKSPNRGTCKPTFTVSSQTSGHAPDIPRSQFSSTLLNSTGSYQTGVGQNLTSSCRFTSEIKSEPEISQKEKSFEKTKCNKIVHQLPERSTNSKKCRVVHSKNVKGLTSEESSVAGSMVKLNGVPVTKCFPVPTPYIQVQTNFTKARQTQNRFSAFNGNLLNISQHSNVSRFTPECNQQKNPQIKSCVPPRPTTFSESKVDKVHHITGGRRINPSRKPSAYVPECSTPKGKNTDMPMTEEEKAAKRRESWRIKKREQRAKRAEKLKKDKERVQCFEKGQEEEGKLSCVVPAHSLPASTMAPREAKQPNSVKSADLPLHNGQPVHFTVKVEDDISSPTLKQSNHKHHSAKVDGVQGSIARNILSVNRTNYTPNSKPNNLCGYSGISVRSSTVTRTANQSRIHQQRLVQVQRRQSLPQRNDRMETAEERHAKQREYWRIRKRLQRARLSVEMKARLKERDALKRCAVQSQGNLEQVRKFQTGFQRVPRPNKNILINASETTSSFIQGNSTVSVPILKAIPEVVPSPQATSCSLGAVQSLKPISPSTSGKLVCVRTSSTKHGIPNSLNTSVNIQRSTDLAVVPVLGSKLANSRANADVLKGLTESGNIEESNQRDRTACKQVLSSDSSLGVSPRLDLVPHDTIKQEHCYPAIESVFSLSEQSQSIDISDVKSSPSPASEPRHEKESSLICDSQATTLLAVASMKKLLEETLSSVVDSNIGQDASLPCKTEDKRPTLEAEAKVNPNLTTHHGAAECNISGYTNHSIEVKQAPTLCHSPLQAPGFSAEDAVLSCQGSSVQFPLTSTAESPCLSQSPEDRTHALSVAVGVKLVYRGPRGNSGKRAGPQRGCLPQACGGQQPNERSELQKKREYWRVMKRRQRAKKAKEKERSKYAVQHKQLSQPMQRKCFASQIHHPSVAKTACHANLNNHAVLTDVILCPARLILSPTVSNQPSNQPSNQLSNQPSNQPSSNGSMTKFSETSQMKKWQLQPSALISASRPDTVTSTQMSHVKSSGPQTEIRRPFMTGRKNNQSHLKAATNQGLDPEEILRRKRMHWRIKKQEQRARKAAREKELRNQTGLGQLGLHSSSKVTQLVQSTSPQRVDYQPKQCQITSFKDEPELCFLPGDDCSDEPLSEAKWRSTYLMDYDAVNQLLVCMVCGEQQYCLSVEGVMAHIEEAHPSSLTLEEKERQDILQAWDEQVAVRERFFTNQLWRQSDCLKAENMSHTAEIEVILDADDLKQTNT